MSRISISLGTLGLLAAIGAQAGATAGIEQGRQIQIDAQSLECKVKTIHGGYGDHEREVLTLKLVAASALGLLDHTEFSTGAYGGNASLCAQTPALAASLAANQGKVTVDVSYYADLRPNSTSGELRLYDSVGFELRLKDGAVITLSSGKTQNVEKK
jgi:hypothetical protein